MDSWVWGINDVEVAKEDRHDSHSAYILMKGKE